MWGRHRQALILTMIAVVVVFFASLALVATLYHAPSCTDDKQDQGETGVDCGGPCNHLCTADEQNAQVVFARALTQQAGRTDVAASIANKNSNAAAKNVPFTVTLYGADGTVLASKSGSVDLPPSATVPVFIPGLYAGYQQVSRAFLTIDDSAVYWYHYTDTRPVMSTANIVVTPGPAPRVTASVSNPTAYPLLNIPVVVTLFDANGNAIAASRTVAGEVPPLGSAPVIFTWNAPFTGDPAREEIVPLVPLP